MIETNVKQVEDDFDLLELMSQDMAQSSELYKPTNYWSYYEQKFVPELKEKGLKDFRRRGGSVLGSFGAVDLKKKYLIDLKKKRLFYNKFVQKIPLYNSLILKTNNLIKALLERLPSVQQRILQKPCDNLVIQSKKYNLKSPLEVSASLNGNPSDVFWVENKPYTNSFLFYFLRYIYAGRFIDFENTKTIVELGSGSGRQVEVLKKLYPHLTFFLFDLTPQLYVCEQYLKSVFPGDVVSYRENREKTQIDSFEEGKIYFFGSWHFPLLKDFKYDLFWNCASFQEMEPNIVENYLSIVGNNPKHIYLEQQMHGKEVATKAGTKGVINPTTLDHYKRFLSDNYNMQILEPSGYADGQLKWDGYMTSVWKNKKSSF